MKSNNITSRPGTLIRWNAIKSILKESIIEKMIVADIGAFDGYILGELKKEIDFVPLLIDIDVEGLKIAKERSIYPVLASGIYIPLKDNSIDIVMCLDVVEHICENNVLFKEINRILKRNGTLIFTTPIADKKLVWFMSKKKMEEIHKLWGHVKYGYNLKEIQYLFNGTNLNVKTTSSYFNIFNRYLYYLLFLQSLPIPVRIKRFFFKMGIYSENFIKFGSFGHLIIAEKME